MMMGYPLCILHLPLIVYVGAVATIAHQHVTGPGISKQPQHPTPHTTVACNGYVPKWRWTSAQQPADLPAASTPSYRGFRGCTRAGQLQLQHGFAPRLVPSTGHTDIARNLTRTYVLLMQLKAFSIDVRCMGIVAHTASQHSRCASTGTPLRGTILSSAVKIDLSCTPHAPSSRAQHMQPCRSRTAPQPRGGCRRRPEGLAQCARLPSPIL
ncbi:hypothetical protein COO60DRAFT_1558733, partial [Scenedesmus sp. NREL 46B-D3]